MCLELPSGCSAGSAGYSRCSAAPSASYHPGERWAVTPASCDSPQDTARPLLRCCLNQPRALQPLCLWLTRGVSPARVQLRSWLGQVQLCQWIIAPPCQDSKHSCSPRGNGGGGQVKAVLSPPAPAVWRVPHNAEQLFRQASAQLCTGRFLQRVHVAQRNPQLHPCSALQMLSCPSSARIAAGTRAGLWPQPHCTTAASSPFVSRFSTGQRQSQLWREVCRI